MLNDENYNKILRSAYAGDERLNNMLNTYLMDTENLGCDAIDELFSDFALEKIEQDKNNTVQYMPLNRTKSKLSNLASKFALREIIEGHDKARTDFTIRAMIEICSMTDWVTQGKQGNPFNADLSVGDTAAAMGLLYTMAKNYCTADERRKIAEGLFKNGILPIYNEWLDPEKHWHALDTMGHNWWLVIVCGAGIAVLALKDEVEDYNFYLNAVLEGIRQWFRYPGNVLQNKKANFGEDGGFVEFIGYLTYGLSNYVIFETMHRNEYGVTPLFEDETLGKLTDYYIAHFYTFGDIVQMANFGDTPIQLQKHQHVIYYLIRQFKRGDLLYLYNKMSPGPKDFPDFLFYPFKGTCGVEENTNIRTPLFSIYRHNGYAVMRTGFTNSDTFLAVKAGESWNHNHLDVGTFIIASCGRIIAADSGTCSYNKPEYRRYYCTPEAHNVVLFNGKGELHSTIESGTKFAGSFPAYLDAFDRGFRYLLVDCCGAYANIYQRFYRHILFLEGIIIFVDDIQTYKDGELNWQMHFDGKISEHSGMLLIDNGGVASKLCPIYPANQIVSMKTGYRSEIHGKDGDIFPESQYICLSSRTYKQRSKLIQAIILPGTNCRIDMKTDGTVIEVMLKRDNSVERIYCNILADGRVMHKNSRAEYSGISTDAFLVYTKNTKKEIESGACSDVALINGSFLKMNGEAFCGSMVKFDAHFHISTQEYTAGLCMDAAVHIFDRKNKRKIHVSEGHTKGTW